MRPLLAGTGRFQRIGLGVATSALALALCAAQASAAVHRVAPFTVDGVRVGVSGGEVRGTIFAGQPGDATQETTIVDRAYHRTFSIIAVPFGTRPANEDMPIAARNSAHAYHDALHDYRARNGEFATDGPTITIFGAHVAGELSQRTEHASVGADRDVDREIFTVEWTHEAGNRIWIVRARQFALANHPLTTVAEFLDALDGLTIFSEGSLNAPTTITPDVATGAAPRMTVAPSREPQLGVPPAYSDPCDAAKYDGATGRRDWRNELGGSYRGVPACGPRPGTGAPLMAAAFTDGAPPITFQFDAAELSLRWMFLAYGTPPFLGNGDDLFENYDVTSGGRPLFRYPNVRGATPPQPGDVLSYDTGGTLGHTSVVVAAQTDQRGNGSVDVIEQGASPRGFARLTVIDGQIFSNYGGYIKGWLSPRPYR